VEEKIKITNVIASSLSLLAMTFKKELFMTTNQYGAMIIDGG
jgi:hypothetical protein